MAPAHVTESDGTKPNPAVLGSLTYMLLNLPLGIGSFTLVVTLMSVGVSTAIIWVGVPVLALAILLWRGCARLERRRVHLMLGAYIASPYRPLPAGRSGHWKTRIKDAATWKDMVYLLLLLPVGIVEFTLMVTFWATSLWLLFLPLYWGLLPERWYPVVWNNSFVSVDSTWEALPWAAFGALLLAATVALTRALGSLHARFARAMLGPSRRRVDALARPAAAAPEVSWTSENVDFRTHLYPGV